MNQTINNKPIIVNTGAFLRAGDELILSENPRLTIIVDESADFGLSIKPLGSGFIISLNGFSAGADMMSHATGDIGSRNIAITTRAARVAEMTGRPVYRIDCMIAEV